MKLVYLSELRLPTKNAHGFQIMNMCSAFAEEGLNVLLLVPWRKNLLRGDPFDFYGVKRNFIIKKLPAIDLYPLRFISEKISGPIHLYSFLIATRIYLFFKPFEILYTREKHALLFFRHVVFEVHMPEQMKIFGFKPRKVIVLTNHISEVLKESGVPEKNILIAPDAVDLSKFSDSTKEEARKKLNFPKDKKIVMYWGNFKPWKGADTLAAAVKYLKDCLVVIVGATKESDLGRIRAIVGDRAHAIVEGFKDQELMPSYLGSADVLVLPNSAKDENSLLYTSPMKLFEYMASGRPIIASNVPSIREILNDKNAVFFEPDSPESLATTVKMLLSHDELQAKLARQARQDVEEYTWDKRAKKILDFINQ